MINIKEEVLEETLKMVYSDIKKAIEQDDKEELIHAKGFCCALENIALQYGSYSSEDIANIKTPIIGNISMSPNKATDLDIPTYLRRQKMLEGN